MGFGEKLLKGSFLRVTVLVCNIAVSLFMMPFLIYALGDRWYGLWALVGAIMGYYGFLDFGLSSAVSRFVSRAYGQKNYDEMNIVINTSVVIFALIALVAIAITCIAALAAPYLIKDDNEAALFSKVILVMGMSMAIGFPVRVFTGVLLARIRYDLITYVSFFKLFSRTPLIVYLITIGYGIFALALVTFFIELVGYVMTFWLARREFSRLQLSFNLFEAKRAKTLFSYSTFTFIARVGGLLRFKVDLLVVAAFLNVGLITHYFVAARLIQYFIQFITSAVGMMSPIFSQYEGNGDVASISRAFYYTSRISTILTVFVGTSIIMYGNVFIERWMGSEYYDSYGVIVILCIGMITSLMQNPSIGLLYGLSKHHYFALSNSCEGVLNLILSLILVRHYGILGVALGTAIPMIIIKLVVQPLYVCRVINIPWKKYCHTIVTSSVKTVVPILIYWFIVIDYLTPSYINIISVGLCQLILLTPICFLFILTPMQRQVIIQELRPLLSKVM